MKSDRILLRRIPSLVLIMVVLCSCLMGTEVFCAGIPMPYTEDAVTRLNAVLVKKKAPAMTEDPGVGDYNVRNYIATYREIFAEAGFDYERSVMKIINDIQFDRYRLNRATIKLNGLARELLRLHVKTGVHPEKYLSSDCAQLLIEFRTLIRSNTKKYGGC